MVEDNDREEDDKKEDKFDAFTPEGEAIGYISLEQARVVAMQTARDDPGEYGPRFEGVSMVFDPVEQEEGEDYYVITMSFRPAGEFRGKLGQEQFFIEKEGGVAYRQVLGLPSREGGLRLPVVPIIALTVVVMGAVVGVVFVVGGLGGSGDAEVPVAKSVSTNTSVSAATPVSRAAVVPTSVPRPTVMPAPTSAPAAIVATATSLPPTALPTATALPAAAALRAATPVLRIPTPAPSAPTAVPPTPPPVPPTPTPRSRIAFTSDRDGDDEVYVMNADGSSQTRLTFDEALDVHPAWSPDGSRIAFSSGRTMIGDRTTGDQHTYVVNADGSNRTRLSFHEPFVPSGARAIILPVREGRPAWSPDGSRIAFDLEYGAAGIYVMNADGSNQTLLAEGNNDSPAWSPDGSRIAFISFQDGDWQVYVMNADGSRLTRITFNEGFWDLDPDWSPDGRRIAFASRRDGNREIYVMNPDGSNLTRLTVNQSDDYDPAWSPFLN